MSGVTFYTGTHMTNWLWEWRAPLFVSRRRLIRQNRHRPALAPWALDSGGFTELNLHGTWTVSPRIYAAEVRRYSQDIGRLSWAAIQDWMCEPFVLAKTGKTVLEHQELTIRSYLDLKSLAPDLPWTPVVQGYELSDYLRHVDMYRAAGVELEALPIVGVGSVCRRQHSAEAREIFRQLHGMGLRLHGFGLKLRGLAVSAQYLASADSMAWSFQARRAAPLPGCSHASCANCLRYAKTWRRKVVAIPGVSSFLRSDLLAAA